MDQYFYLTWVFIFFLIWLILFLHRKDVRQEMLFISFLFGFGGLASEKTYIVDWWQPLTITHTKIGIEDFIIGFCIGGIASVIYEEIYKRHLSHRISASLPPPQPGFYFLIFPLLYLTLFYMLNISSFYSSVFSYLIGIGCVLLFRRDLILDSIFSGFWMLIIGIGVYLLLFFVDRHYINEFWFLHKRWYTTLFFGIPIGEYIWYFLTGAYIGPLYSFIKKQKIIKNN